jgi:hypothetical protein
MYSNYTSSDSFVVPIQIEIKNKEEYIPLKKTDIQHKSNNGFIEGMNDGVLQFVVNNGSLHPYSVQPANEHSQLLLLLKDDFTTRLFIGGISIIGLFTVFHLLYKRV